MIHVTPLLYIDRSLPPTLPTGIFAAYLKVFSKRRAYVSDERAARIVLMLLGLSPELAEDRVHFALTGEVLEPA